MKRKDAPGAALDELTSLLMAWIGLSMRITRGSEAVKCMADAGLTMAQISAMHILAYQGSRSVTDLGGDLGQSTSAASSMVQRLVEQGLATRTEDASDRRHKRVELTQAGRELVERMMKGRQRELRAGLEHLSDETRAELEKVMRRIVGELSQQADRQDVATQAPLTESKDLEADQ